MMKALECVRSPMLSGGRADTVLNFLILGLILLIFAVCLFLVIRHRARYSRARNRSEKEKPSGFLSPRTESSTRATHISTKKPRRRGAVAK